MSEAWQTLKSKIIHENPWYSLREDDVIRPDGKEGKYYFIDGTYSVIVIPETENGDIYLVGQTRYPAGNSYSWEFVAGGFKPGETMPLDVAKKELKEETGLEAGNWINLGFGFPVTGYSSEKCFFFIANNLTEGPQELEPTEDIKIRKADVRFIEEMIESNEITDMMTIAAFYKYLLHKKA